MVGVGEGIIVGMSSGGVVDKGAVWVGDPFGALCTPISGTTGLTTRIKILAQVLLIHFMHFQTNFPLFIYLKFFH